MKYINNVTFWSKMMKLGYLLTPKNTCNSKIAFEATCCYKIFFYSDLSRKCERERRKQRPSPWLLLAKSASSDTHKSLVWKKYSATQFFWARHMLVFFDKNSISALFLLGCCNRFMKIGKDYCKV